MCLFYQWCDLTENYFEFNGKKRVDIADIGDDRKGILAKIVITAFTPYLCITLQA